MSNTSATMTPYAAAKIVNAMLAEAGVEKTLPPQMFYTYVKKGYIASTDGRVTVEALAEWAEKYIAKQTATLPTQDALPGL